MYPAMTWMWVKSIQPGSAVACLIWSLAVEKCIIPALWVEKVEMAHPLLKIR